MSKKKKNKDIDNGSEYAIFLLSDNSIKRVPRNKLMKVYNEENIEFVLIPMEDGRQYAITSYLPTKFGEFHISFRLEMQVTESEVIGVNEPFSSVIKEYDIKCKDYFEFIRFEESLKALTTMNDEFVFDLSYDSCFGAVEFIFSNVGYEYITTDKRYTDGRLKGIMNDMAKHSFYLNDFLLSIDHMILGNKADTAFMTYTCDTFSDYRIVIDTEEWSWDMIETPITSHHLKYYDDPKYLLSMGSSLFDVFAFLPMSHIMDLYSVTMSLESFSIAAFEEDVNSDNFVDTIVNEYGYDFNMNNLTDGPLSNMVCSYYCCNIEHITPAKFVQILLNINTIMAIMDIYNTAVIGYAMLIYQVGVDFASTNSDKGIMYHYVCEEMNMLISEKVPLYDRFMSELHELLNGDLPERYMHRNPSHLSETPYIFPF